MIRRFIHVRCDLCEAYKRCDGQDDLTVEREAKKVGWRIVGLHYTGISAHFCPQCAFGKTNAELAAKIGCEIEEATR